MAYWLREFGLRLNRDRVEAQLRALSAWKKRWARLAAILALAALSSCALNASELLRYANWEGSALSGYQFADVSHCGRSLSITVAHVMPRVSAYNPEAALLALDEENDIAIYSRLKPVGHTPARIAREAPRVGEALYSPTYLPARQAPILMQLRVAGVNGEHVILQGGGFLGMSGSGVFNESGRFVGSMSVMYGHNLGNTPLIGMTQLDKIKILLREKVCDATR